MCLAWGCPTHFRPSGHPRRQAQGLGPADGGLGPVNGRLSTPIECAWNVGGTPMECGFPKSPKLDGELNVDSTIYTNLVFMSRGFQKTTAIQASWLQV